MSSSVETITEQRSAPLRPGVPALRRAVLVDPRPGRVRAFVEDDFHHFEIELAHDLTIITDVVATTIRHPWATCAGAAPVLAEKLRGVALRQAAGFDSPLTHCTHLYDLALLAAAKAGGDSPELFRMFVADMVGGGREAIIDRNGTPAIAWHLDAETILPPHAEAGRNLRQIKHWAAELEPAEREAALLLRRAVFISIGRTFDPDAQDDANKPPPGACFTHQPENYEPSARLRGSRRDFTHAEYGPLAARAAEVFG